MDKNRFYNFYFHYRTHEGKPLIGLRKGRVKVTSNGSLSDPTATRFIGYDLSHIGVLSHKALINVICLDTFGCCHSLCQCHLVDHLVNSIG